MENLQSVYKMMEDDLSKKIFLHRVMWSISKGEESFTAKFAELNTKI